MTRAMKGAWLLLLALGMASPLAARIGETEAQLVGRFGAPVFRGRHSVMAQARLLELGPSLHFRQEGWTIVCDLVEDRCVRIGYARKGDWTEEHFATVLNANSEGGTWRVTSERNKTLLREWKRSDGATARWSAAGGLQITVPAYEHAKSTAETRAKTSAARPAKI